MSLAFIVRTSATVALLTVVFQETGWATTLLLSLFSIRIEIENVLFSSALQQSQAPSSNREEQK